MAAACNKVLNTPELLEAVLLRLPPRDLLLAQRVNTAFKATIDRSIHIQRKLFFKSNERRSEEETGMVTINPFLLRILRLMNRTCTRIFFSPRESKFALYRPSYELDERDMSDTVSGRVYIVEVKGCIHFRIDLHAGKFPMPHGSWHKMLASDPPTFEFLVYADATHTYSFTPVSMSELIEHSRWLNEDED